LEEPCDSNGNRRSRPEGRSVTSGAPRLTLVRQREIMRGPGVRGFSLAALEKDRHDRLQPQGGGSLIAPQPIDCRRRLQSGERERRTDFLSEQRGGSRGTPTLHQGVADRVRETGAHGRLSRQPSLVSRVVLQRGSFSILFALTLLACGCGGKKQAKVTVPPPP